MTEITARDGIKLYAESQGPEGGVPIVFVHELAGSCRAFDLQAKAWRDKYRCITFNARGYPPSEIAPSVDSYSQGHAAADIGAVMDGVGLRDAHIIGVSMGSASTLQFALRHPDRVRSIISASIGSGSDLKPGEFAASMEALAEMALTKGMRSPRQSITPRRRRAIASRKRTRPNIRISSTSSPPIRRSASPTRCAACNRSARRFMRIRSASRR